MQMTDVRNSYTLKTIVSIVSVIIGLATAIVAVGQGGEFSGTWQGIDVGDSSTVTLVIVQAGSRLTVQLSDSFSLALDGTTTAGFSGFGDGTASGSVAEVTFQLVGPESDMVEVVAELTLSGGTLSLAAEQWGAHSFSPPGLWADLQLAPTTYAEEILNRYDGYDHNDDGDAEIRSLQLLTPSTDHSASGSRGLVLVLIEERLLADLGPNAPTAASLGQTLKQFQSDLDDDGYDTCFAVADVYDGPRAQDGLSILALRELLRALWFDAHLRGVILVGAFPEALLVRSWQWQQTASKGPVTIGGIQHPIGTLYFTGAVETIAGRADIVLADLDGSWENVYCQPATTVTSFRTAVAPQDILTSSSTWGKDMQVTFVTESIESESRTWSDFFLIDDLNATIVPISVTGASSSELRITAGLPKHDELSTADMSLPNPLARPEILVSRVNAKNVAVNPDPQFLSNGVPINVFVSYLGGTPNQPSPAAFWQQDPVLERELLLEYFRWNHRFRTGGCSVTSSGSVPCQISAISTDDYQIVGKASGLANSISWLSLGDVIDGKLHGNPSLLEYAEWWLQPAAFRYITAHSSPQHTRFPGTYLVDDLESLVSTSTGGIWAWAARSTLLGVEMYPSFEAQGGRADLSLHRSLWESGVLSTSSPCLLIHQGCDANTPMSRYGSHVQLGRNYSWTSCADPHYADFQNVESLQFYMACLAIISRAKGFNDEPLGVSSVLSSYGSCFGEVWLHNFDEVGALAQLNVPSSAASKKAYWWSITGDWTLELSAWYPG